MTNKSLVNYNAGNDYDFILNQSLQGKAGIITIKFERKDNKKIVTEVTDRMEIEILDTWCKKC